MAVKTAEYVFWVHRRLALKTRTDALNRILDDLEAFDINLTQYYSDLEPQGVLDGILAAKLNALLAFFKTLGWSELVSHVEKVIPVHGNALEALELVQTFVIPEARRLARVSNIENPPTPTQWFWQFLHPKISKTIRELFERNNYTEAAFTAINLLNSELKDYYREKTGQELDGYALAGAILSGSTPVLKVSDLTTESGRNVQKGLMYLIQGLFTGARNPIFHGQTIGPQYCLHILFLVSLIHFELDYSELRASG